MTLMIVCLFFSFLANSQEMLTFDEIHRIQSSTKKKIDNHFKKKAKTNDHLEKQLQEANKKLESYRYIVKQQFSNPIIIKSEVIGEGDFIGAYLKLGVMASNTVTHIVLSGIEGIDLPENAKITCEVLAKYKRICGRCTRLIVDGQGIDIDAELKNKDGSNCVIGTLYEGKELYLSGIFASEMAKGAMAISQSSIPTVGGNIIESSAKNKILQGFINTADTGTEMMEKEYQTKEPIVLVPKDTRVIVYFNQKVEL